VPLDAAEQVQRPNQILIALLGPQPAYGANQLRAGGKIELLEEFCPRTRRARQKARDAIWNDDELFLRQSLPRVKINHTRAVRDDPLCPPGQEAVDHELMRALPGIDASFAGHDVLHA